MKMILFFAAAALLTLGHWFKTLRWQQFVSVYEDGSRRRLMSALAAGYLMNFCLPLHLGDLLRTWLAGRTMKNGLGLALATVLVDRILDVVTTGLIFVTLALIRASDALKQTALYYGVLMLLLLLSFCLMFRFRVPLKRWTGRLCGLFNPAVERHLLLFFWALISACKDMRQRLNKWALLANTVLMWGCYFLSYGLLAAFLEQPLPQILLVLFGNLERSSLLTVASSGAGLSASVLFSLYLLLPLAVLLILAAVKLPRLSHPQTPVVSLIPQAERTEQLHFLRRYFDGSIRDYLQDYIAMNRDVTILRDLSAGSAATTMLCLRDQRLFYRKYAFGDDGKKLQQQAQWIHNHSQALPLPEIIAQTQGPASYCYDMVYRTSSVNFFEYVHCHSAEESWRLLKQVLETLCTKLYLEPHQAEPAVIGRYISDKVQTRLQDIMDSGELKPLTQSDHITINGASYRNLPALLHLFAPDYLSDIFAKDPIAPIHGDLTIENLVADPAVPDGFYLIDPNTGNILDSPCLDYGKLLQSLHGKYEFLKMVSECRVAPGEIEFLFSYTDNYNQLYERYAQWLSETFDPALVRSIYCHELVHWLRLMPYKLKQAGKKAAVYYAAFILVLNDVADRLEELP